MGVTTTFQQVNPYDNTSSIVLPGLANAIGQLSSSVNNMQTNAAPPQCGYLQFTSSTQITFIPKNGATVQIAGVSYLIPSAGVVGTNSGLTASTGYYVYLYNNAGTLTIEFSPTGHVTDTTANNTGVEIKSGDNSRTLIGAVFTTAGSQFVDSGGTSQVASWFNRRNKAVNLYIGGTPSTSSTTPVVLVFTPVLFFAWGDEAVCVNAYGQINNSSGAGSTFGVLFVGAGNASTQLGQFQVSADNSITPATAGGFGLLSEAFYQFFCCGYSSVGTNTVSYTNLALNGMYRG